MDIFKIILARFYIFRRNNEDGFQIHWYILKYDKDSKILSIGRPKRQLKTSNGLEKNQVCRKFQCSVTINWIYEKYIIICLLKIEWIYKRWKLLLGWPNLVLKNSPGFWTTASLCWIRILDSAGECRYIKKICRTEKFKELYT